MLTLHQSERVMDEINENDLARLLVILLRIRTEILEQAEEMELDLRGDSISPDKTSDASINTKEIAAVEYLCFECSQLN